MSEGDDCNNCDCNNCDWLTACLCCHCLCKTAEDIDRNDRNQYRREKNKQDRTIENARLLLDEDREPPNKIVMSRLKL